MDPITNLSRLVSNLLLLNTKMASNIRKRGQEILVTVMLPQHIERVFYVVLLESFTNTAHFILEVISSNNISNTNPLRANMRTLLEIYSRSLTLLNAEGEKRLERIIGDTIWTFRQYPEHHSALNKKRLVAIRNGVHIPEISEIVAMKKQDRDAFKRKYTFELDVPPNVIRDYHIEKNLPLVSKEQLIKLYREYSDQLHGNIYYNMSGNTIDPKYQYLTSALFITTHFIRTMKQIIGEPDDDVNELVDSAISDGTLKSFSELWEIIRLARKLQE